MHVGHDCLILILLLKLSAYQFNIDTTIMLKICDGFHGDNYLILVNSDANHK